MKSDIIDRACQTLGITKKALALQAGVNPSRISDVRYGRLKGFSRADTRRLVDAFPACFTVEALVFFKRAHSPRRSASTR